MSRDDPWHGRTADRKTGGPRYLLHYLTANTYRKARIFDSDRYERKFAGGADVPSFGMSATGRS